MDLRLKKTKENKTTRAGLGPDLVTKAEPLVAFDLPIPHTAGSGISDTALDLVTSLLSLLFSFALRIRGKVKSPSLGRTEPSPFLKSQGPLRLGSPDFCSLLLGLARSMQEQAQAQAGTTGRKDGVGWSSQEAPVLRDTGGRLRLVSMSPVRLQL